MSSRPKRAAARILGGIAIGAVWGVVLLFLGVVGVRLAEQWPAWAHYRRTADAGGDAADASLLVADPTLGWTARPSASWPIPPVAGEHAGGSWTFNEQGVRSDTATSPHPASGTLRVLAMGDSFTFGTGPLPDTWSAQLEAKLTRAEVLNVGIPEYDVGQVLLRWEADGAALHPDVVVVAVIEAMLRRSLAARANSGRARPLFRVTDAGALVWPVPPLPPPIPRGSSLDGPFGFFRFAATGVVQGLSYGGPVPTEPSSQVMATLAERVRAAGATPVFVYLPIAGSTMGSGQAVVEAAARASESAFVDLTPAFLGSSGGDTVEGPWFLPDMHYNRAANGMVADAIAAVVRPLEARQAPPAAPPP